MRSAKGLLALFPRLCAASLTLLLAGNAVGTEAPPPLQVEQIAPGNFVHYGSLEDRSPANLGDQANVGFIVGERCVAVIDTGGSLAVGRRLAEKLGISRVMVPSGAGVGSAVGFLMAPVAYEVVRSRYGAKASTASSLGWKKSLMGSTSAILGTATHGWIRSTTTHLGSRVRQFAR